VPLNLPGRETRIYEPPYTDLRQLVRDAAAALRPFVNQPYGLVGHSVGALVAFELAVSLHQQHARLPDILVLASCRTPHLLDGRDPIHSLPDDEFIRELELRYNGIPQAVRENRELLQLLLPALRADVRLLETYDYKPQPPLSIDMLVLGGIDDTSLKALDLQAWGKHTTGRFSARLVPGGHFFLLDDSGGAANPAWKVIVDRLRADMSR
jgi:surfactin synthase thioesterase subunit